MISKRGLFVVFIVISLLAIAAWYFSPRPPESIHSASAESPPSTPVDFPTGSQTKIPGHRGAAAAVRAQTIAESGIPQSRRSPSSPAKTEELQQKKVPANISTPPRKSAKEVIASFTSDDPTQVFLPETVRYHAAVQAEEVDPAWGPQTESALTSFIGAQLGSGVELLEADCRTDLCEISLVETTDDGSDGKFHDAMKRLRQQPWWDSLQLDQETEISTWDSGRFVTIHYFSRK